MPKVMKAQVPNVRLLDCLVQPSQHVIDEDCIPCGGEEDIWAAAGLVDTHLR
jgi:hypothetical protein